MRALNKNFSVKNIYLHDKVTATQAFNLEKKDLTILASIFARSIDKLALTGLSYNALRPKQKNNFSISK